MRACGDDLTARRLTVLVTARHAPGSNHSAAHPKRTGRPSITSPLANEGPTPNNVDESQTDGPKSERKT